MSIVVAVSLGTAVAGAEHGLRPVSANPRELPSLLQKWAWKGQAESAILVDGVIYVRGGGRVAAIKADNGRRLWETVCAKGEGLVGQGPVLDGDVLAVSFNGKLALLDRETGRIGKTLELGVVYDIVATPLLVVAAGRKDRVDLVRIDGRSGEVLARTEVGGIVYDVRMAGRLAIAIVGHVAPGAGGSDEILAGYRVDGLGEAWGVPFDGFPALEWIEGSLYAADAEGEGDESFKVYRRIDTESGQLGPALPQRVESRVDGGLTWELEIFGLKEGKRPARLRRNSIKTGQPLWTVDLPGDPHGWVRDGDALYLHCDHEGGRGYLIVLDWVTGAVKQAAHGLRDVRGLFSNADTMIAWQEGGLTAFSGRSFGAPEKYGRSLRDDVEEILRGVTDGGDVPLERQEHVQAAVADLKTLGPRGLPFVAEQVPRLTAPALVAAARVLGDGRYKDAAPLLAARLKEPPPPARTGWERWDPASDVLNALSQIGGDQQVGAVSDLLMDAARDGSTRRQALATLASIGTPAAVRMIERILTPKAVPERWWQPATPEKFADLVGRPDLEAMDEAARERQDWDQMDRIDRALGGARVSLPDGALVIFHDSRLGGHKDLWMSEADRSGRVVSPARFLGGSAEGPIHAFLDGDTLVVERANPEGPLRVGLSEVGKDSDGDGLPDLVELRLKTDPNRPDTDGDGILDSEDPAPNGAGAPQTEDQEIVHSTFQQFFMFESNSGGPPEPAIMVGDSALQWVGRRGPTITLSRAQDDRFVEEAGRDGIAHIFIEPGGQVMGRDDTEEDEAPVGPDERQYKLTIYRGGLNAVGYDLTVRKLGRVWVIKECRFAWVS